jgi:hypothetical protein
VQGQPIAQVKYSALKYIAKRVAEHHFTFPYIDKALEIDLLSLQLQESVKV